MLTSIQISIIKILINGILIKKYDLSPKKICEINLNEFLCVSHQQGLRLLNCKDKTSIVYSKFFVFLVTTEKLSHWFNTDQFRRRLTLNFPNELVSNIWTNENNCFYNSNIMAAESWFKTVNEIISEEQLLIELNKSLISII